GYRLPGRSVRAKLSGAFLVLVTLGALHIGITEWGAWRRRIAVGDLHSAVVRQRIMLQTTAALDEFQKRIGVAEVLDQEAPGVAAQLRGALREQRLRLVPALDSAAVSASGTSRADLERLAADVSRLFLTWERAYRDRTADPTTALTVLAREADPLAHRLRTTDLPGAVRAEQRAVMEAEGAFMRVDRTAAHLVWAIFATSVLIAAALAYLLIADLLPRLAALKQGVERLHAGDLEHRIELAGADELSDVAGSFNEMAGTLHGARDELEASNRQLASAVQRLEQSRAELVQAEKLKAMGGMLAGLAHELNNPLASVLGYGELIEAAVTDGRQVDADNVGELVAPLVAEAFRAREIVRNMLQFSRASVATLQPVNVTQAMKVAAALRSYAFTQSGFRLQIEVPRDLRVIAEPQKLQQVFLNLITNAYDALSDGGGSVLRVSAAMLDEKTAEVVFEDDGPGLADPDRAFDPFYTTKPVGRGTGLGLALVHRFQEEFGGSASLENRLGGGARITLRFVAAKAGAETPDAPEADPSTLRPRRGFAPPDSTVRQRPACVLVVEDEAPLRVLQARILSRLGVETLLADGGAPARDLLLARSVDAIISDVKMPGDMNGPQLFAWVCEHRPELRSRFLFVTGDVHDPTLREMLAREPDRFVTKPFVMDEYLRRVSALLENSETMSLAAAG
ncbi:MAG: ATP-binding protein, partial [Longimicrobiales bacterium]